LIKIESSSRETPPSFKFNAESAEKIMKVISKSSFAMVIKIIKQRDLKVGVLDAWSA